MCTLMCKVCASVHFVVAPPPHPRQRLSSLDSDKGFKMTFSKFLSLFLQKESGFQGNALRNLKFKKFICTFSTEEPSVETVTIG